MRAAAAAIAALTLVSATGCSAVSEEADPATRALGYAAIGAATGAWVGTLSAITPPVGAAIGAAAGGVAGAAVAFASADPVPSYTPIDPAAANGPLGFYDTWPPGVQGPPLGSETPRAPLKAY